MERVSPRCPDVKGGTDISGLRPFPSLTPIRHLGGYILGMWEAASRVEANQTLRVAFPSGFDIVGTLRSRLG